MWKKLRTANFNVVGKIYMCLAYARQVFGIASRYPTAWAAWLAVPKQYKHTDRNFPPVPVAAYFSGAGGAGHVEIWDGSGFNGSPYATASGHVRLAAIAQVEQHYGVKFAGWSEWLDGVLVSEYVAPPIPNPAPKPVSAKAYVVKKGDTLIAIARKHGTTYQRLAVVNGIKNPNLIKIGQLLKLS